MFERKPDTPRPAAPTARARRKTPPRAIARSKARVSVKRPTRRRHQNGHDPPGHARLGGSCEAEGGGRGWQFWRAAFWLRASWNASAKLEQIGGAARVAGLSFKGEVVAIEAPQGQRIESDEYGDKRWLPVLYFGMFVFAGALMLVNAAREKRRTASDWWSVRGEGVLLMTLASPWMKAACLMAVPSMLGFLPLAVMGWVPGSVVAFAGGIGLTVFAIFKTAGKN